jgi:uncharacterized protein involved in exopolysaccharide biosynthesis
MTFYQIIVTIVENRYKIFVSNIVIISLSIIFFLFFIPDKYNCTSTIISSNNSGKSTIGNAFGIASQFGINIGNTSNASYVYPEIIRSKVVVRNLLKKKVDSETYGKNRSLISIITGQNLDVFDAKMEIIATNKLLKKIKVTESLKTKINTIVTEFDDPSVALAINDLLIKSVQDHQSKLIKKNFEKTRVFIEKRIVEANKELINAENQVKTFEDRNRKIQNSPNLKLNLQRLKRDVSVLTGVFTSLKQELEKTKIEELKDQELVLIINVPDLPLGKSNIKFTKFFLITVILTMGASCIFFVSLEQLNNNINFVKLFKDLRFQLKK